MKQEQFIVLPQDERLQIVWDHGDFISQRSYYNSTITLFALGNFFVEVFFDHDLQCLSGITLQTHQAILYGYVKDLDLSELTSLLVIKRPDNR